MFARTVLPALALASTVLAQTDSVCSGDVTITTSDDATPLNGCNPYRGTVTISSDAAGQIDLGSVQAISGDLTCKNASQLTAISANYLSSIGGTFDLEEIQILSSLNFGALSGVNEINWIALPGLQALNFGQGVQKANNIYISNTGLTTLSGIELEAVGEMNINNNIYLTTINVNSLTNVTRSLSFSANGMNLDIEFPNLENAANLTFIDVSKVSMPSLSLVRNALGFYDDAFESFVAPNLTAVGGTIAFVNCSALNNVSMPELTQLNGGLFLANNTELMAIDGFPALKGIGGDINFYGTFDSVMLPSLVDVKGASNVYTSSSNSSICDVFSGLKSKQVIKGKNTCDTSSSNTDGKGGSGSSSGSSSGNNKNAGSRTISISGFVLAVAGLLFI